jgi:hypothetical protein
MLALVRRFYWPLAISTYWLCALWFLFWVSPISVDGSGPVPTLSWGGYPPNYLAPTLAEYDRSTDIRLQFLYPYWIAASIVTFLGCGPTTWLLRARRQWRSHLFLISSATTLFSLLLVGMISDLGIARHIWSGPTMYEDLAHARPFLAIMIPMSLLAGFVSLARSHLSDYSES